MEQSNADSAETGQRMLCPHRGTTSRIPTRHQAPNHSWEEIVRKLIIAALLLVAGGLAYAGSEKHLDDGPDLTICENTLELLKKGNPAGFEMLSEHWIDRGQENRAKLTEFLEVQFPGLQRRIKSLGDSCGVELIHAEEAGAVRRYYYLCKYELGWVRWRFTFYRPAKEWFLQGCNFNDNEDGLFAESGHCLTHDHHGETSIAKQPHETSSR